MASEPDRILGELVRNHEFALEDLQRNSWMAQIKILQSGLSQMRDSYIAFEYAIPRMGKRVDVIILVEGTIFVLEFKVGERRHSKFAMEQALDYSLDLKNFHEQSHSRDIVPIVVATEASHHQLSIEQYDDGVYYPMNCNKNDVVSTIMAVVSQSSPKPVLISEDWIGSLYKPTPTIIEAAQALYRGHSVEEISRSDAGAINLSSTSESISEIIETSKQEGRKSICFITGVPGAGKTLAGINIANERHNVDAGEHAVFLSGNGPLVKVLQEALARDELSREKNAAKTTKKQALAKTKAFIQNIHHFRDDSLQTQSPPIEKVVIFDEAQRAWTLEKTRSFMATRKGRPGFAMSEPQFLISVLDRHQDWATIICLIGGGQEINTGEAGLLEWFAAIGEGFPHWRVYASDKLIDLEYTNGEKMYERLGKEQLSTRSALHLAVSVRSFRSERVSDLVKAFLDLDIDKVTSLVSQVKEDYPIVITRDLSRAKLWLRSKSRGGESIGITASSGAHRLKPYGIDIRSKIQPTNWFLNPNTDVRSAGFLEHVATEFDIQGLELDWTCVAWDANLRKSRNGWEYKSFRGTEWQDINQAVRQRYLLNAYRVLMTRARQGIVMFVPEGDINDRTRLPEFYDATYQYCLDCGISLLDDNPKP